MLFESFLVQNIVFGSTYVAKTSELLGIKDPFLRTKPLSDDCTEFGVAERQPPSRCDSIGLVLELVRPDLQTIVTKKGQSGPGPMYAKMKMLI
jgi:hypothetical protein